MRAVINDEIGDGGGLSGLPDFVHSTLEMPVFSVEKPGKAEMIGFTMQKIVAEEIILTFKSIVKIGEVEIEEKLDHVSGGLFIVIEPENPIVFSGVYSKLSLGRKVTI